MCDVNQKYLYQPGNKALSETKSIMTAPCQEVCK